ncbi:hypothetical protein FACS189467_8870 [Bacteroidia bacterium]|nr:hypothetical protein FACS189467_8870 [Bacteroidia bacterium]
MLKLLSGIRKIIRLLWFDTTGAIIIEKKKVMPKNILTENDIGGKALDHPKL